MRQKKATQRKSMRFFYSVVALALIALGAALFLRFYPQRDLFSPIGTVRASEGAQQKDREGPAKTGAPAPDGMEAFRELVVTLATDKEFLRTLAARIKKVEERERELDQREKDLSKVQIEVMRKLQQFETIRNDLKEMTDRIDADAKKSDKLREEKISTAVKNFKAISYEAQAENLLQMDLEDGVTIMRRLTSQTVGGIGDAMVEIINANKSGGTGVPASGMTKQEQLDKMAELWEHLVNPDKPFTALAVTEPRPK